MELIWFLKYINNEMVWCGFGLVFNNEMVWYGFGLVSKLLAG